MYLQNREPGLVGFIPDIDCYCFQSTVGMRKTIIDSHSLFMLLLSLFVGRYSYHEQEQHRHQQKQQALGGEEELDILCLLELLTLTMANVNLDKYFSVS